MTNSVISQLERAMTDQRYVWLPANDIVFMGFIVRLSDSLVMLHRFWNFTDNGYVILRVADVAEVNVDDPNIVFFERMIRGEGIASFIGPRFSVPVTSMSAALRAICAAGLVVLLDVDEESTEYLVGAILEADDLHTRVIFLSASGVWDSDATVIETRSILRAEFDTPYLKALKKYSPPQRTP